MSKEEENLIRSYFLMSHTQGMEVTKSFNDSVNNILAK